MAGRKDERFASDLTVKLAHGEGVMRNVSASGVYLVTDAQLKQGELLEFSMEFSGADVGRLSARCEARVVRVERHGTRNGVGAAFESIEFHRAAMPAEREPE